MKEEITIEKTGDTVIEITKVVTTTTTETIDISDLIMRRDSYQMEIDKLNNLIDQANMATIKIKQSK